MRRLLASAALIAASALALAGCSGGGSAGADGTTDACGDDCSVVKGSVQSGASAMPVVAVSSYPLAFIAETVGGDKVEIVDLSSSGGHAHDMELSPAQVNQLSSASVALYLSQGFQPAVETAIQRTGVTSLDGFTAIPEGDIISGDPHVWLDPLAVAEIGDELAATLADLDPANAEYFKANASDLDATMSEIDGEYSTALAACGGQTLLTTHEAFGYLAKRYDLEQVGILGVDPDAEPSPARLVEISKLIEDRGVTALFVEPAGAAHDHDHESEGEDHDHENEADHDHESDATTAPGSDKLASALGIPQETLDTLETQVDPTKDLVDVFRSNLVSLQHGLSCAV